MKARDNTCASVWDAPAGTREQAANLRARAQLMRPIAELIRAEGRKQAGAAERCGVTQPRTNDLLRGRVSRFSLDAHVHIATALGWRMSLALEADRTRPVWRLNVSAPEFLATRRRRE